MSFDQLFAGAGQAAIRFPQELFPLEGFVSVHDDPSVRILMLRCKEQVAIVCAEMVMLPRELIEETKAIVRAITQTKEENIWVHTTHVITTPHAPHAPKGMGGVDLEISEEDRKTLDFKIALFNKAVTDAVEQAALGAAETFRAAKLGVGIGECTVNVNRDVSTPHGWWINFEPNGPSNHKAAILRFDDEAGAPIGALISYGLKPCCIDNSELDICNRRVSSDVPGLACTLLEEKLGAPVLFAMSAAGDQVPLEQAWYDVVNEDGTVSKVDLGVQVGLEMAQRLGRRMADELAPALESITCDQAAPAIDLDRGGIEWMGKKRNEMVPTKNAEYEPTRMEKVDVQTMTLGEIAFVGVRPEINTVTEAELHKRSPYKYTLLMSMVDGGQKYMPEQAAYDNFTWEAQNTGLMPGAAEAWLDEAIDVLNRMKNK